MLAGKGFGIIEDCGGTYGLKKIAEAYKKGSGAEYEKYVEWIGIPDLDLASFDIEEMNLKLKDLPGFYAEDFFNFSL